MIYDFQKASIGKRFSAFLFDFIFCNNLKNKNANTTAINIAKTSGIYLPYPKEYKNTETRVNSSNPILVTKPSNIALRK